MGDKIFGLLSKRDPSYLCIESYDNGNDNFTDNSLEIVDNNDSFTEVALAVNGTVNSTSQLVILNREKATVLMDYLFTWLNNGEEV